METTQAQQIRTGNDMIHVGNKQHGQLPVREGKYLGHVAKGLQQHNNDDRQWAASYPNGELEKNFGHVANDLQQHVVISTTK